MLIRIIFIALLLSSCSIHKLEIRQGNLISAEMVSKLKAGMTQQQVKTLLGTPLVADPFHASRWDYVYRFTQEGVLQEGKRLTLYFEGDKLHHVDDETHTISITADSNAEPVKQ